VLFNADAWVKAAKECRHEVSGDYGESTTMVFACGPLRSRTYNVMNIHRLSAISLPNWPGPAKSKGMIIRHLLHRAGLARCKNYLIQNPNDSTQERKGAICQPLRRG
jgi:hypothetical protein